MDRVVEICGRAGGISLRLCACLVGRDILLWVEGGERPHIGCAVQAVPRASLTGSGERSATSSVLNLTGHKDEFLCRNIAEQICKAFGVTVVCTGGVHVDGISRQQIEAVMKLAEELTEKVAERLAEELSEK